MRLPLFEKALTAVRFIHDQMDLYSLDNTRESVSMDDLVWTIEQYQEIKIILHYVSFESEYIYSELQIKDSTAEIYVRDSLSHKLRRYAVAKSWLISSWMMMRAVRQMVRELWTCLSLSLNQ